MLLQRRINIVREGRKRDIAKACPVFCEVVIVENIQQNACEAPSLTVTAPEGLIEPFAPADAVMVWVVARKLALMV